METQAFRGFWPWPNRIFSALAIALLVAIPACSREATTPPATVEHGTQLPADQIVYGLRHVMTNEGVRKALLLGDTAYVRDEGRRFDITGVDLDFYDENGRESGELTSKTGEYVINSGAFIARGTVVLVTRGPNGARRLETEELHYDPQANQIWSDVPFVLREGGETSSGASFRSDTEFQNFTVQGGRGRIPSSEIVF